MTTKPGKRGITLLVGQPSPGNRVVPYTIPRVGCQVGWRKLLGTFPPHARPTHFARKNRNNSGNDHNPTPLCSHLPMQPRGLDSLVYTTILLLSARLCSLWWCSTRPKVSTIQQQLHLSKPSKRAHKFLRSCIVYNACGDENVPETDPAPKAITPESRVGPITAAVFDRGDRSVSVAVVEYVQTVVFWFHQPAHYCSDDHHQQPRTLPFLRHTIEQQLVASRPISGWSTSTAAVVEAASTCSPRFHLWAVRGSCENSVFSSFLRLVKDSSASTFFVRECGGRGGGGCGGVPELS